MISAMTSAAGRPSARARSVVMPCTSLAPVGNLDTGVREPVPLLDEPPVESMTPT